SPHERLTPETVMIQIVPIHRRSTRHEPRDVVTGTVFKPSDASPPDTVSVRVEVLANSHNDTVNALSEMPTFGRVRDVFPVRFTGSTSDLHGSTKVPRETDPVQLTTEEKSAKSP